MNPALPVTRVLAAPMRSPVPPHGPILSSNVVGDNGQVFRAALKRAASGRRTRGWRGYGRVSRARAYRKMKSKGHDPRILVLKVSPLDPGCEDIFAGEGFSTTSTSSHEEAWS